MCHCIICIVRAEARLGNREKRRRRRSRLKTNMAAAYLNGRIMLMYLILAAADSPMSCQKELDVWLARLLVVDWLRVRLALMGAIFKARPPNLAGPIRVQRGPYIKSSFPWLEPILARRDTFSGLQAPSRGFSSIRIRPNLAPQSACSR